MTAPKKPAPAPTPRVNHNVKVTTEAGQPMLKCGYCGDWILVMPNTVVYRFIELATFWSRLHNHHSR